MRFTNLTYPEIRECAEQGWLAVVPTGCTEQQGPHLTVDFDTWFVEAVARAAAERAATAYQVHSLVLPALPFGPTPEHRNYGSGFIDLPVAVHEAVVQAVLASLAQQGFTRLVVWRGCGGHDLRAPIDRFNVAQVGKARAFLPALPYHDIWCRVADPSIPGGHADSFTTSLALCFRPDTVRRDRIPAPDPRPIDWDDPQLDFTHYSDTGVIGDPNFASAALGRRLWEACVEEIALVLKSVAESPVEPTS
jgi:creatinine amidohydrolase